MSTQSTLVFIVPGDINARTGGYRYDKRIIDELRDQGWTVTLLSLEGDYPFPTPQQLEAAKQLLESIEDNTDVVIDGLAYSVMPEQLAQHSSRLKLIALIHHPLALETDLTRKQSSALKKLETSALSLSHHVITTSESTAAALADYQVPAHKVSAVPPGVDAARIATGSEDSVPNLLCVATLTARKGHGILLDALKQLENKPWHLYCAGSLQRDMKTVDRLSQQREVLDLTQRVSFVGELDDAALDNYYQQADLFLLPSFHEGYGMVLDEAISHGLPIIASDAGAIADTVPTGAGVLVQPGNANALSSAIRQFLDDEQQRKQMRDCALQARESQRSWRQAGVDFAQVVCHV